MEAQMLHLGNRTEEAARALEEAREHAPADEEVKQWIAVQQENPGPPPLPDEEEETAAETPAAADPPEAPSAEQATPVAAPGSAVCAEEICRELFGRDHGSADIERTFATTYAGRPVEWRGVLKSSLSTSFDFVFGSQPCTKATVEIAEVGDGPFGGKTVQAIVQLPPEARDQLSGKLGQDIAFRGELLKVDGLVRNLFVKNAKLDQTG
jgi:hypothetical protein